MKSDMPLYVPRARRTQEDSEQQCTRRHSGPGRKGGKKSRAQPSEAQKKRLPKSSGTETDKADSSHNTNGDTLISVGDKTYQKNSSSGMVVKLSNQGNGDLGIERQLNEEADLRCVSNLSVQLDITAPRKIHSGSDLNPPRTMEVADEKVSIDSKVFLDNGSSAVEEESWDSIFDDDGDCVNPEVVKELNPAIGKVQSKAAKQDRTECKSLEPTADEEHGNIVEIYGFPAGFQSQNLISAFSCFRTEDFTIKWVDDCHALGIFSSAFAASQALTLQHPYVKVRPLSQGIKESKVKAKTYAEYLLPHKTRPATSATLARRLVTGALGLKSNVSREQRETERLAIRQARDRKRQVAKQRQDIWNGVVP